MLCSFCCDVSHVMCTIMLVLVWLSRLKLAVKGGTRFLSHGSCLDCRHGQWVSWQLPQLATLLFPVPCSSLVTGNLYFRCESNGKAGRSTTKKKMRVWWPSTRSWRRWWWQSPRSAADGWWSAVCAAPMSRLSASPSSCWAISMMTWTWCSSPSLCCSSWGAAFA